VVAEKNGLWAWGRIQASEKRAAVRTQSRLTRAEKGRWVTPLPDNLMISSQEQLFRSLEGAVFGGKRELRSGINLNDGGAGQWGLSPQRTSTKAMRTRMAGSGSTARARRAWPPRGVGNCSEGLSERDQKGAILRQNDGRLANCCRGLRFLLGRQ